jgi:hypothetical protein
MGHVAPIEGVLGDELEGFGYANETPLASDAYRAARGRL